MSQVNSFTVSALTKLLHEAFIAAHFDCNVNSPAGVPELGLYEWRRVCFDGAKDIRLLVGARVQRDESDGTVSSDVDGVLKSALTAMADLISATTGQPFVISTFQRFEITPESLDGVTVHVQGTSSTDSFLIALEETVAVWLASIQRAPSGDTKPPSSLLDTLMQVELPVSILLGSREASLSDVIQWGPGAIVEFENGLGDPVDVIVNKQKVARGSVVLVDGNYGIKITEVLAGSNAIIAF